MRLLIVFALLISAIGWNAPAAAESGDCHIVAMEGGSSHSDSGMADDAKRQAAHSCPGCLLLVTSPLLGERAELPRPPFFLIAHRNRNSVQSRPVPPPPRKG